MATCGNCITRLFKPKYTESVAPAKRNRKTEGCLRFLQSSWRPRVKTFSQQNARQRSYIRGRPQNLYTSAYSHTHQICINIYNMCIMSYIYIYIYKNTYIFIYKYFKFIILLSTVLSCETLKI